MSFLDKWNSTESSTILSSQPIYLSLRVENKIIFTVLEREIKLLFNLQKIQQNKTKLHLVLILKNDMTNLWRWLVSERTTLRKYVRALPRVQSYPTLVWDHDSNKTNKITCHKCYETGLCNFRDFFFF